MPGRGQILPLAVALAALVGLAGCAVQDHPNDPRPPEFLIISAEIDDDEISVGSDISSSGVDPATRPIGAGPTRIVISNRSSQELPLEIEGPVSASTFPIQGGGGTDELVVDLKPGEYEVSAGDESSARPTTMEVGPVRETSEDELLLP